MEPNPTTGSSRNEAGAGDDSRLAQIFDAYLAAIEAGEGPDPNKLLAENPTLASRLRVFLEILDMSGHMADSAAVEGPVPSLRVGDFRIVRAIGRGGMGVVYEAEQVSLGRRVALKILPLASALDPAHLQRFQVEARAAAQLHHPHIVPVFAFGSERGIHYYAMQFIEGQTLAQLIASLRGPGQTLPPTVVGEDDSVLALPVDPGVSTTLGLPSSREFFRTAARFGYQTATALEHSHGLGVLHRDIKPANLLIDDKGDLWVTDFGLARLKEGVELTRTNELPGTLRYMCPERVMGQSSGDDVRGDVYSLGATLHELLTLQPVYDARDSQELLRQVAGGEPMHPRWIDPSIPIDLETIVRKAMAREPGERYASAGEMAEDLERFLEGRPILAKRPSLFRRTERWVHRRRVAVLSAVALALVGTLTTALILAYQDRTHKIEASLRISQYEVDLRQAARLIQQNELGQARDVLARHEKVEGGHEDPRGFPWYYLWRICHAQALARTINAHQGEAYHVECSPDGRAFASCGLDGMVKVWDLATGDLLKSFRAHDGEVNTVVFSPDGRTLATAGDDGLVKTWDFETQAPKKTFEKQKDWVLALQYSKDGRQIYSGDRDGWVRVWDAETGQLRDTLHERSGRIDGLALSPDGKTIASAAWEGVTLWDLETRKEQRLPCPGTQVHSIAFSPDGKTLASGSEDNLIRLWDVRSSRARIALPAHQGIVQGVAFSPDGQTLASCGDDGTVRLWDGASGAPLEVYRSHERRVWSIAFSADGRRLASAGRDATVKLWDRSARGHRELLLIKPTIASALGFSPGSDLLRICGRDGVVSTLKVADGSPVHAEKIEGTARAPFAEMTPDGKNLATLDLQGTLTVCDIDDNSDPLKVVAQGSIGTKPDVSRTGGMIAAGGHIALVAGGRSVAIVEDGKDVLLIDPRRGNSRRSSPIRAFFTTSSSAGDLIASTDFNVPILWEPGTGQVRKAKDPGHRDDMHVLALAFSPDGRTLATGGNDGVIKLWKTDTMTCWADLLDHRGFVDALAFSPDGKVLASGGSDKTVRLWNVATGHDLLTLEGHTAMVRQIRFSPDGSTLMTYAENPGSLPEVYLWPAPIEQPEGTSPNAPPVDNRMTISHPTY